MLKSIFLIWVFLSVGYAQSITSANTSTTNKTVFDAPVHITWASSGVDSVRISVIDTVSNQTVVLDSVIPNYNEYKLVLFNQPNNDMHLKVIVSKHNNAAIADTTKRITFTLGSSVVHTWTGGTDTSWGNSQNWDVNGVPSSNSVQIIIPKEVPNYPTFTGTSEFNELYVTTGARLTLNGGAELGIRYLISNDGDINGSGAIKIDNTEAPSKVVFVHGRGVYNSELRVNQSVEIVGFVSVKSTFYLGYTGSETANLDLYQGVLFAEKFEINNLGQILATFDKSVLEVGTSLTVKAGVAINPTFQKGILILNGSLDSEPTASYQLSKAPHKTYFTGPGHRTIQGAGKLSYDSVVVNLSDSITFSGTHEFNSHVLLENGKVKSVGTVNLAGTMEEKNTLGKYHGANLTLVSPNVKIPTDLTTTLIVQDSLILSENVVVRGTVTVNSTNGAINFNNKSLHVESGFSTSSGGAIYLMQPSSKLIVDGAAFFGSTDISIMNDGKTELRGSLSVSKAHNYEAIGNHITVFNGTNTQTIDFSDTSYNFINHLDIDNSAGISFVKNVKVKGNINLIKGTVTGTGVRIPVYQNMAGSGVWSTDTVEFASEGNFSGKITHPTSVINSVVLISRVDTLQTDLLAKDIHLIGGGQIYFNGKKASSNGDFKILDNAFVTMANSADVLQVGGAFKINSTGSSTFDQGLLKLFGSFELVSGSFFPKSTHKTDFASSTVVQNVSYPSLPLFGEVAITGSQDVNFPSSTVKILGNLTLAGSGRLNAISLELHGDLATPRNLLSATSIRFKKVNASLPDSVDSHLIFSANQTLSKRLVVKSPTAIELTDGTNFKLGGNEVFSEGDFIAQAGTSLTLDNSADTLNVFNGNLILNGITGNVSSGAVRLEQNGTFSNLTFSSDGHLIVGGNKPQELDSLFTVPKLTIEKDGNGIQLKHNLAITNIFTKKDTNTVGLKTKGNELVFKNVDVHRLNIDSSYVTFQTNGITNFREIGFTNTANFTPLNFSSGYAGNSYMTKIGIADKPGASRKLVKADPSATGQVHIEEFSLHPDVTNPYDYTDKQAMDIVWGIPDTTLVADGRTKSAFFDGFFNSVYAKRSEVEGRGGDNYIFAGLTDSVSLEAWVMVPNISSMQNFLKSITGFYDVSGDPILSLMYEKQGSSVLFHAKAKTDQGDRVTSHTITDINTVIDTWMHIALVYSNATNKLSLFINGAELSSTALNAGEKIRSDLKYYYTVGAKTWEKSLANFYGLITEVRLWNSNRSLVLNDKKDKKVPATDPQLVGYWKMDSPESLDGGTKLRDFSSRNVHLKIRPTYKDVVAFPGVNTSFTIPPFFAEDQPVLETVQGLQFSYPITVVGYPKPVLTLSGNTFESINTSADFVQYITGTPPGSDAFTRKAVTVTASSGSDINGVQPNVTENYQVNVHNDSLALESLANSNIQYSVKNNGHNTYDPVNAKTLGFNGYSALAQSSIVVATSASSVVGSAFHGNDFYVGSKIEPTTVPYKTFSNGSTFKMRDGKQAGHLGIEIIQSQYIQQNSADAIAKNIVIKKFDIQNISGSPLSNVYVGLNTYFSLNQGSDKVAFIDSLSLLYWKDATGSVTTNIYGVLLLSHPVSGYNALNAGSGATDSDLFTMMSVKSTLSTNADTYAGGVGAFIGSLGTSETQTAVFAFVVGRDQNELINVAREAKHLYKQENRSSVYTARYPHPNAISRFGNTIELEVNLPADSLPTETTFKTALQNATHITSDFGHQYDIESISSRDDNGKSVFSLRLSSNLRNSSAYTVFIDSTVQTVNGTSLNDYSFSYATKGNDGATGEFYKSNEIELPGGVNASDVLALKTLYIVHDRWGETGLISYFYKDGSDLKLIFYNIHNGTTELHQLNSPTTVLSGIDNSFSLEDIHQFHLKKGEAIEFFMAYTQTGTNHVKGFKIPIDFIQEGGSTLNSLNVSETIALTNVSALQLIHINPNQLIDVILKDDANGKVKLLKDFNASSGVFSGGEKELYTKPAGVSNFNYDIFAEGNSEYSLVVHEAYSSTDSIQHKLFSDRSIKEDEAIPASVDRAKVGTVKNVYFNVLYSQESSQLQTFVVQGTTGFQLFSVEESGLVSKDVKVSSNSIKSLDFYGLMESPYLNIISTHGSGVTVFKPSETGLDSISGITSLFPTELFGIHDRKVLLSLNSDGKLVVYNPTFFKQPSSNVEPENFAAILDTVKTGASLNLIPSSITGSKVFVIDSIKITKPIFIRGSVPGIQLKPSGTPIKHFITIDSTSYGKIANVEIRGTSSGVFNASAIKTTNVASDFTVDSVVIKRFDKGISFYSSELKLNHVYIDSVNTGVYASYVSGDRKYQRVQLKEISFSNMFTHAIESKNVSIEVEHSHFQGYASSHESLILSEWSSENFSDSDNGRFSFQNSYVKGLNGRFLQIKKEATSPLKLEVDIKNSRVESAQLSTSDTSLIYVKGVDKLFAVNNLIKDVNRSLFYINDIGTDSMWVLANIFENVATESGSYVFSYTESADRLLHIFNNAIKQTAPAKFIETKQSGRAVYGNLAFSEPFASSTDTANWGIHFNPESYTNVFDSVTFIFNENYTHAPGSFGVDLGIIDNFVKDPDGSASNIGFVHVLDNGPKNVLTERLQISDKIENNVFKWNTFSNQINKDSLEAYYVFWGDKSAFYPDTNRMARVDKSTFTHSIGDRTKDRYFKVGANHVSTGVISYSNPIYIPAKVEFKKDTVTAHFFAGIKDSVEIKVHNYSSIKQQMNLVYKPIDGTVVGPTNKEFQPNESSFFVQPSVIDKARTVGKIYIGKEGRIEDSVVVVIERFKPIEFATNSVEQKMVRGVKKNFKIRIKNPDKTKQAYTLKYNLTTEKEAKWLTGDTLFTTSGNLVDSISVTLNTYQVSNKAELLDADIYLVQDKIIRDTLNVKLTLATSVSFSISQIKERVPYGFEKAGQLVVINPDTFSSTYYLEYDLKNQSDKKWFTGDTLFTTSSHRVDSIPVLFTTKDIPTNVTKLQGAVYLKSEVSYLDTVLLDFELVDPTKVEGKVAFSNQVKEMRKLSSIYEQAGIVLDWVGNGTDYLLTTERLNNGTYSFIRSDTLKNITNIALNGLNGFHRFVIAHLSEGITTVSDTIEFHLKAKRMTIYPGFWQLVTTNVNTAGINVKSAFNEYSDPIYTWDINKEEYIDVSAENLNDLNSYWIKPKKEIHFTYSQEHYGADNTSLTVPLKKGWNQVGQPWDWPILWKYQEVKVGGEFVPVSSNAVESLEFEAFHYITNERALLEGTDYDSTYTYIRFGFNDTELGKIHPRKGFWVFVNADTEMRFKNVQYEQKVQEKGRTKPSTLVLSSKAEGYNSQLFFNLADKGNRTHYHYRPPVFNVRDVFKLNINERPVIGVSDQVPVQEDVKEYTFSVWGTVNEKKHIDVSIQNTDRLYYWFYQISKGKPERITDVNKVIVRMKSAKETVKVFVTSNPEFEPKIIPLKFQLHQNYPNPFNPSTTLKVDIPFIDSVEKFKTQIHIYNILGQRVKTIFNGYLTPDTYEFKWHGKNQYNVNVASGVYFYQVRAGRYVSAKKMVLIK